MVTARTRLGAEAWTLRARIEHDAAVRFERLALEVARFDEWSPVVAMLEAAARDERRHFALCRQLVSHFGAVPPSGWADAPAPVAPPGLPARQATAYELCAACCVSETESMATLTELLHQGAGEVAHAVREIAHDEVVHAQLGWAHLSREAQSVGVAFLGPRLPAMLRGSVDAALFKPASDPALEDPGLVSVGVLPHSLKRQVFVRTLDEVVLPGLHGLGVDVGPARAWLDAARA
jgi:hypothetical protein